MLQRFEHMLILKPVWGFQYMRDGGGPERALPIPSDAQNGTLGVHGVREVSAQTTVHQATALHG